MPPFQTVASTAAALGHALIDGIWLGALLAIVLAVSLRLVRGLNAASRHAIWYAALIAIAAVPVAGFSWSVTHASTSSAQPARIEITQARENSAGAPAGAAPIYRSERVNPAGKSATSDGGQVSSSLPAALPTSRLPINMPDIILAIVALLALISIAGLIGVLLSLARLLAVKRDSRPFDAAAEAGLRRWSARPAAGRAVSLRVSQGVDVPAAVGFLHPSILVPASWPANLEADELDKIVMHEYSHLLRADDWTAFVQRVAERLFWFNPAVRYIAGRANLEREIACDDRVVAEYASATSYAECLWRIAQFSHMPAAKSLVPAALVTRAQIVERIELLMNTERDILPRIRPAAVAAIVPLAVALLIVGVMRAPAITLAAAPRAATAQTHAAKPVIARQAVAASKPATSAWIATKKSTPPSLQAVAGTSNMVALSGNGLDVRTLLQDCAGCDLSGKDLRNTDLHGLRLTGDNMSRADMRGANLRGTNFEGVDLSGARFDNADLTNAVFAGTDLKGVSWTGAKMEGIVLQGVAIDAAMLHSGLAKQLLTSCQGCDMSGLDMRNLDLRGVRLQGADLSRADLRGANLAGAILDGVDLDDAMLDGTDLTNARLNGCNLSHVDLRRAHIQGLKLEGADLREMKFSGLNVRGLTADGADLSGAQLRQVDLSGVRMNGSDFSSADLTGAQLVEGEFAGADFRQARLDGANLQRARLCGYNTSIDTRGDRIRHDKSCADLSGASTKGADFRDVQICDWHNDVETCQAISSADLKKYSHSRLTGAVTPTF
ncbi:MAG TPA: pentapeptide repeat-containing protein [Candidatus Eremiobacteraceae bacterium]